MNVETVYSCPLPACPWTFAPPAPDPVAPGPAVAGESLEDSIAAASLAILGEWYAGAEDVIRAHLESHALLEWVTEVMRLRGALDVAVTEKRREARNDLLVTGILLRKLGPEQ